MKKVFLQICPRPIKTHPSKPRLLILIYYYIPVNKHSCFTNTEYFDQGGKPLNCSLKGKPWIKDRISSASTSVVTTKPFICDSCSPVGSSATSITSVSCVHSSNHTSLGEFCVDKDCVGVDGGKNHVLCLGAIIISASGGGL